MLHPKFIFISIDLILLCWYGTRKDSKFTAYVPAIRLFQRYKTMNANTVTASNGPTMKYHCTVVLAEKKKKKHSHTHKKKIFSHFGSSKHEGPEARQVRSLLKFIFYPRLSKNNNSITKKKTFGVTHVTCSIRLCYDHSHLCPLWECSQHLDKYRLLHVKSLILFLCMSF